MNKHINKFIILFFLLLHGCGYKPILVSKNFNFSIGEIEAIGNKKINSELTNKIKLSKNKENKNLVYNIKLDTIQKKNIVSKDQAGDPNEFEMFIATKIEVTNKNAEVLINRLIQRKTNYKNNSDKFELKRYEDLIINTLTDSILDEIFSILSSLNDS